MENENIFPLKKIERFYLCTGSISPEGEFNEGERIGVAFMKDGAKMFRLKLWMFPKEQLFLAADDNPKSYVALSLEERRTDRGDEKTFWNRVGTGELIGGFIQITFPLFQTDVYLCLFPEAKEQRSANAVA